MNSPGAFLSTVLTSLGFDGLRPDVRPAPHRPPRYRLRAGDLRHHPAQVPQDRCAGSHQRPPHQDRHGVGPVRPPKIGDVPRSVSPSQPSPAPRPHDTPRRGATLAAPTNWPTENPKKTNHNAPLGATDLHGSSPRRLPRRLAATSFARSGPSRSAVPIDREQSFRLIPIIRSGITISLWTGANGTVG